MLIYFYEVIVAIAVVTSRATKFIDFNFCTIGHAASNTGERSKSANVIEK